MDEPAVMVQAHSVDMFFIDKDETAGKVRYHVKVKVIDGGIFKQYTIRSFVGDKTAEPDILRQHVVEFLQDCVKKLEESW
jgi:hypothetical protein